MKILRGDWDAGKGVLSFSAQWDSVVQANVGLRAVPTGV